ncbi:MAG: hypothetical protein QM730_02520 [Anaerolineales bacterium]
MNKSQNIQLWIIFLLGLVFVVGCGTENSPRAPTLAKSPTIGLPESTAIISTQPPTVIAPYIHYTPPNGKNIHLEFDYPSSWVFGSDLNDKDLMTLSFGDPRFQILATPVPNDFHPTPNDFGKISITIWSVKSGQSLDELVKPHKEGFSGMNWIKELSEYKITVDGRETQVFEYRIDFSELYTSVMFERDIFFVVNDQLYQITFQVAEKERGGEFEKGYADFFNSLKITQ